MRNFSKFDSIIYPNDKFLKKVITRQFVRTMKVVCQSA